MMINVLHYEPRGQRQRFEPQIQQHREREEQGRHIHLYLKVHIHLNLGACRAHIRRFLQPPTARVTAIFAAFIGALSFAVMSSTTFPFVGPHIALADQILFIGALIGSSAVFFGGLPLVMETWRVSLRSRLLFSTPLLARGWSERKKEKPSNEPTDEA